MKTYLQFMFLWPQGQDEGECALVTEGLAEHSVVLHPNFLFAAPGELLK